MSAELQDAIEQLYVAFSDVPKPDIIEGCPCCLEHKGVDVLLNKPLKQITPDEMSSYAASAFLTVGDIPDFLYLLPRILDIAATDRGWWPDVEVVLRSIRAAEFPSWSGRHKTAVLTYFDAVLEDILKVEKAGWLIDEWICALGRLFADISLYLSRLETFPPQVVSYYEHNSESLIKGRLSNCFWEDKLPAYQQVLEWFNSPRIKTIIRNAYRL